MGSMDAHCSIPITHWHHISLPPPRLAHAAAAAAGARATLGDGDSLLTVLTVPWGPDPSRGPEGLYVMRQCGQNVTLAWDTGVYNVVEVEALGGWVGAGRGCGVGVRACMGACVVHLGARGSTWVPWRRIWVCASLRQWTIGVWSGGGGLACTASCHGRMAAYLGRP